MGTYRTYMHVLLPKSKIYRKGKSHQEKKCDAVYTTSFWFGTVNLFYFRRTRSINLTIDKKSLSSLLAELFTFNKLSTFRIHARLFFGGFFLFSFLCQRTFILHRWHKYGIGHALRNNRLMIMNYINFVTLINAIRFYRKQKCVEAAVCFSNDNVHKSDTNSFLKKHIVIFCDFVSPSLVQRPCWIRAPSSLPKECTSFLTFLQGIWKKRVACKKQNSIFKSIRSVSHIETFFFSSLYLTSVHQGIQWYHQKL